METDRPASADAEIRIHTRRRLVEVVLELQSRHQQSEELLRVFDSSSPPDDNEVDTAALIVQNNDILTRKILASLARLWVSAATPLAEIAGIERAEVDRLVAAGVESVETLLQVAGQRSARERLAHETNLPYDKIRRWVNQADLFRISGIGGEYAGLLEAAGVDSVPELARRDVNRLTATIRQTNADHRLVQRVPSANTVRKWITEARTLPRAVEH
jgi:predicted flap endonuclease-1-like 5' DNA nuclease